MVDARAYLMSFKTVEARIELKLKQIQRLEDRLCDISAPLGNEHVHGLCIVLLALSYNYFELAPELIVDFDANIV